MDAGYFPPVSIWNWSLGIDGILHKKGWSQTRNDLPTNQVRQCINLLTALRLVIGRSQIPAHRDVAFAWSPPA